MSKRILVIIPTRGFSFQQVGIKVADALSKSGVETTFNPETSVFIPTMHYSKMPETPWFDGIIFVCYIGTLPAKTFAYWSSPWLTNSPIFYGVIEGHPILDFIHKQLLQNKIVTPSKFVKDMLEETGIKVKAIVPHGVDHSEFKVTQKEISFFRSRYKNRKLLYYLANPASRKGIPALIQSMITVKKHVPNVHLIIETEEPSVNRFMFLAQQLGVDDVVEVNGLFGRQTRREIAVKMNACDLYVHAAYGEGFGLPILEAMACRKAPVVCNAPPMNELVSRKEGWLVPYTHVEWQNYLGVVMLKNHVYSPERFGEEIVTALENPKETMEKGEKAYEKSLQYNYVKVYSEFKKLI